MGSSGINAVVLTIVVRDYICGQLCTHTDFMAVQSQQCLCPLHNDLCDCAVVLTIVGRAIYVDSCVPTQMSWLYSHSSVYAPCIMTCVTVHWYLIWVVELYMWTAVYLHRCHGCTVTAVFMPPA